MADDPVVPDITWKIEDVVPALSWWPEVVIDGLVNPEHPEYSPDEEEDDICG